jgi:hypothetical protein
MHHKALLASPARERTTLLELLVEASPGRQSVVIVAPKGRPTLDLQPLRQLPTLRPVGGVHSVP